MTRFGLGAAVLLLSAALSSCTPTDGSAAPATTSEAAGASVGSTASALQACPEQGDTAARGAELLPALSFDCPGGGTLDLGRAPGEPTVLNLWGSWCTPCRDELPVMQQFADAAAGQVRVMGVISKDGRPQAESFAADAGVTFPSAFDGGGKLMTELGLHGLPYTYFLDADGALVYTQVGPVASLDELKTLAAAHLGVQL
jgi:cytochrome c biogenesis protein CcmG, thiol:disulfide interchange protein DsbE